MRRNQSIRILFTTEEKEKLKKALSESPSFDGKMNLFLRFMIFDYMQKVEKGEIK